ncbi:MAG: hypothetical protein EZS28_003914 [Streblomastix strix]|uniref:Tyr recombinase domain-containing protein n=1 Tax=Streblomastix strix TaxID=222440 RepID=A0A5J4X0I2_9EUKA|nr:MAG: hypothetical protein EZS28_003914 [Streblomastix strix]
MQTRASTYNVVKPSKEQDCKLERLEQPSTINTAADEGTKLVMGNNSNRCLQRRMGSNVEDPITREKNCMRILENSQAHIIQLKGVTCYSPHNEMIFEHFIRRTIRRHQSRTALPLAGLVNSIQLLPEHQGLKVGAKHIPGIMSKEPDSLSRLDQTQDYAINRNVMHIALMKLKVEITMDAFATCIIRLHGKFCSVTMDIWAMARVGLSISWENQTPLLYPSIPLLLCIIKKVKEVRVKTAVIISPKQPSQYWLERISTDSGLLDEDETMVSPTRRNVHVQGFTQPGERLFRFLLEDYGLKQAVVQKIVETWHGQWRRHVSALTAFAKYLEQNSQQWKELRALVQPNAFMANFLSDWMKKGAFDNSLKSCRGALAVLLSFIGDKEEVEHSKLIAQLMKPVMMRTRHKDREIEQWDLNMLLEQIIKEEIELLQRNLSLEEIMTISLTLYMIFNVSTLAELFRATFMNETEKEITLEAVILKKPSRIIKLKIKKTLDQKICSVRWWKIWYKNSDKNLNPTTVYLWNTSKLNRTNSPDSLSKGIRTLIQKAGIVRSFTITSMRSATITKLINMGANSTVVDGFTHHSDVASTVRQYYDKNSCEILRALIAEVKEESVGESESEIEAEEELGLTDHTLRTVGESFQHTESNKQRGSSPSLEEVMHDLKWHAIYPEKEVSSTFIASVSGSPP